MDAHPINNNNNNFKGVMLCERPPESWKEVGKGKDRDTDGGQQPFLTACAYVANPVGLPPCKKVHERGKPRKLPALQQHLKWLAAYSTRVLQKSHSHEEEERSRERQRAQVKKFSASLRAAICEGKDVSGWRPLMDTCKGAATAVAPDASSSSSSSSPSSSSTEDESKAGHVPVVVVQPARPHTESAHNSNRHSSRDEGEDEGEDMASFVDAALAAALSSSGSPALPSNAKDLAAEMVSFVEKAMQKAVASCYDGAISSDATASDPMQACSGSENNSNTTSSSSKRDTSKRATVRPKWALTEEQVANREEREEEELLEFASQLDFDEFIQAQDGCLDGALLASVDRCRQLSLLEQQQQQQQKQQQQERAAAVAVANPDRDRPATSLRAEVQMGAVMREQSALMEIPANDMRDLRPSTGDSTSSQGSEKCAGTTADGNAWKAAKEIRRRNLNIRNIHSSASVRSILERSDPMSDNDNREDRSLSLQQTLPSIEESVS